MTEFQIECRRAVEGLLVAHGIDFQFEPLPGDPDRTETVPDRSGHLRAEIATGTRLIEIYLYRNEAGFRAERNWYVFERHRFEDSTALISALLEDLDTWLTR